MEERTVSRDALFDSDASSDVSASEADLDLIRQTINAQLGSDIVAEAVPPPPTNPQAESPKEEENVSFRLFATGPAQVAKLRVKSPDLSDRPAGLVTGRPEEYYFQELAQDVRDAIASVAVTGDDVLKLSKEPWPGCAFKWRVTELGRQKVAGFVRVRDEKAKGRTRPGKKSRIAKRIALKTIREEAEKKKQEEEEMEMAKKKKAAQRNREKKQKKRQRDKEKKAVAELTGRPTTVGVDAGDSG